MRHLRVRRDSTEAAVVRALRAAGAMVWRLDAKDLPDLLVGHRGRFFLLEVKSDRGALSDGQARFFLLAEAGRLPVRVVRDADQALAAIGVELS